MRQCLLFLFRLFLFRVWSGCLCRVFSTLSRISHPVITTFATAFVTIGLLLGLTIFPDEATAAGLLTTGLTTGYRSTTVASIHTYNEQPGQTTFRSKQSLRDRRDRSWQVILFKRYQGDELQGLYLRLIGFPGLVSFDVTKPLNISTGASKQWQTQPELDPQTQGLPENANQYNVAAAIADITGDIPLQVAIPLGGGSTADLVLPPFAVHEWRALNALSPDQG